jgi:4-hydroxybenzoate polyprenyltransferase
MSQVATPSLADELGFLSRLGAFARNVFEPKLHVLFAASWSLSLLGNLHAVSDGGRFHASLKLVVLVFSVFTCLFFLRMVDEVKDYDYDVVHNPDRPLVSGLVTRAHIVRYCLLFAALALSANALLSPLLLGWVALDLCYGLFQIVLEKRSRLVRESMVANLIAVYPVNVGLSVYTVLFFLVDTGSAFQPVHAVLVLAYACAFLHFEFARKSGWPALSEPSERLYSHTLGLGGALTLSTGFGLAAIALAIACFAPWTHTGGRAIAGWLPLLALLPMAVGLALFAKHRTRRHKARPPAVAFLFSFYFTMLAHALTVAGAAP